MNITKEHRRNKSSLGSSNTFVVNSVVKQFDDESDSDQNVDINHTCDAPDLSSIYDDKTKDLEQNESLIRQKDNDNITTVNKPSFNIDNISLPTNIFNFLEPDSQTLKDAKKFHDVFSESCIVKLYDEIILQKFIAIVYNINKTPDSFSCFLIDKFGCTFHNNINISKSSKYFEAIHNLPREHQNLNVSKCVAASVLQKYAYILKHHPEFVENQELLNPITAANTLINSDLIDTNEVVTPLQVCLKIQQFSLLNDRQLFSNFIDVVYDTNLGLEKMEQNNSLVFFLGEQLEQLFNPLTEYSPEEMEQTYKPTSNAVKVEEVPIIQTILKEFISVQTYLTIDLVRFLTKFIIPLRIAITKQQIPGLTSAKFNEVFPPTIDEVTRVNCIFLDALKISSDYGLKECMKCTDQTISYFYKAYTRHEAATKNCFKKIEMFFEHYPSIKEYVDLNKYTVLKINTVINAPQEKLFKIKLILDRLMKESGLNLLENTENEVTTQYKHIIDVINQFGTAEELKEKNTEKLYQQRILTPSGKLLTEIATDWPVELQYKWLKRKVVGTFDCINQYTGLKNCIVIFSDYIVCLEVLDDYDITNNPLISDILMNSLINEKPLPNTIPRLRVTNYSAVSKTLVTAYGGKGQLRIDLLNDDEALYMQLVNPTDSVEYICELLTKACILCKSSAFHLFRESYSVDIRDEKTKFNCYVTAHDLLNYEKEKIKSPFTIFLNIAPSINLLKQNGVFYGFFVNNVTASKVEISMLSLSKTFKTEKIECSVSEYNHVIMKKLTDIAFVDYYYSLNSPLIDKILSINATIVDQVEKPLIKLKESVMLSNRDLKRFSTLLNPKSPLLNSSLSASSIHANKAVKKNEHLKKIEAIEKKREYPPKVASSAVEPKIEKEKKLNIVPVTNLKENIPPVVDLNNKQLQNPNTIEPKDAKISNKKKEKRKKKRLSGFFKSLFGGNNKSQEVSEKGNISNGTDNSKILISNYKQQTKPAKISSTTKPKELTIKTLASVSKKENLSSPSKEIISSPVKIQREQYKEDDLPKLNSNLDSNLFKDSRGSRVSSNAVPVKNEKLTIATKSPFIDEGVISENNESDNSDTEIGQAYISPISSSFDNNIKMITPEKVDVFNTKHSVFDTGYNATVKSDEDNLDDIEDVIIEDNGKTKRVKISQSPSFRELFLKLETDIKPYNVRSSPNYWSSTSLNTNGLKNDKERNAPLKNELGNIYETVVEEDEQDDNNTDLPEEDINQLKKSLIINTKSDHVIEIPKHSPLEAQFPTSATSSKNQNKWIPQERYGSKFKVVKYERAEFVSPQKSDFLASPSKTPLMRNSNDDITVDIKTMTLDGVNLDFVSPVKASDETMQNIDPGRRIISDLKIDFSDINIENESFNKNTEAFDASKGKDTKQDSPHIFATKNQEKDSTINTKNKKIDIRSESFGYLSDFI